MLSKKIFLFIIVSFTIITVTFASNETEKMEIKDAEVTPLVTVKGRLSLQDFDEKELLILTTPEGKQYALKGPLAEKELGILKDLERKEVILAGIPSNIHKKTVEIQQYSDTSGAVESQRAVGWEYNDFLVLYIDRIEETEEKVVSSGKKEVKYEGELLPISETFASLAMHRIKGKVISANLRKPIPTLEIQDTSKKRQGNVILLVPGDTIVLKAMIGKVERLYPTAIKKGDILDLWFKTEGDKNSACIITILNES